MENAALKRKHDMYTLVRQACEENRDLWRDCGMFCQAFKQFKKAAFRGPIDFDKVDAILKYKLDRLMFNYKTKRRPFFQKYYQSRIMAHLAMADPAGS